MKFAIIMPPIIKQIVATKDGHCKFDKPIMEWPEVQPPSVPCTKSNQESSKRSLEKIFLNCQQG